VIAGVYIVYKERVKKIKEKANIDRQLTEYEMKALHAQMNPHFIFNCLNSIREMILNNENNQASHYLSKFAQLIRITLNNSSKPFVSLNNNIDYLQRYLEMEKIRNPGFSYTIEVDEQLHPDELMMPPMLLQPFLENAIWHGILPGKELILDIRFLKKDQQLVCVVDDNGIGIETSIRNKNEMANNPIGIANVKERIKVLNEKYNLQSNITIEDKSNLAISNGTGTTVRLYFPLKPVQS
jgi:sensor histidine kinase YesM